MGDNLTFRTFRSADVLWASARATRISNLHAVPGPETQQVKIC